MQSVRRPVMQRCETDMDCAPDALLKREETAKALTARGYPVAATTLASKVSRGGGPPYVLFGRVALYKWSDALKWAEERLVSRCKS